jgi:hypothetical protein
MVRILLFITLSACSLACSSANNVTLSQATGNAKASQQASDKSRSNGQTVTLGEQGLSFTLPMDWSKDEQRTVAADGEFAWRGQDSTRLIITINRYKPEYGGRSIEEETDRFYQLHKEGGSEDVRILEVGGLRGVHYLINDENSSDELSKKRTIFWASQYVHKGQRQVLFVNLSSPAKNFAGHRDALYSILNSIKFIKD